MQSSLSWALPSYLLASFSWKQVGFERDWFQASLESTLVLTLLTTLKEKDKHSSVR